MRELPPDLIPLPTAPWAERPASLPLNVDECRTALWLSDGSITNAAARLKVGSARLRNFVANSAILQADIREMREEIFDQAELVVREAIFDAVDAQRRDSMAKFVLNSSSGRIRGMGNTPGNTLKITNHGPLTVSWATSEQKDPSDDNSNQGASGTDGDIIEGTYTEAAE